MQPTLLILAAGMGSRYGSLKQIDRFGPSGETIVEYSIYDAIRAGFDKVVMVVRREFLSDFKEIVLHNAMKKVDIRYVFQELDKLPPGFSLPADRIKPWGTAHAVLMAAGEISAPFGVINADDFYGHESYKILSDFLSKKQTSKIEEFCVVDYKLKNTLSESGTVSRGVCTVDREGYLTDITENRKISRKGEHILSEYTDKPAAIFTGDERVSMNLMGFMPSMFLYLKEQFADFLVKNGHLKDSEFFLPFAMNEAILQGKARVRALPTREKWFGVTYREDREVVMNNLKQLVDKGVYPANLWS